MDSSKRPSPSKITSALATRILLAMTCLCGMRQNLESSHEGHHRSAMGSSGNGLSPETGATFSLEQSLRRMESTHTQCSVDTDCSAQGLGFCLHVHYSNRPKADPVTEDIAAFRYALHQAYAGEEIWEGSFLCDAEELRLGCVDGYCGGKNANSNLATRFRANSASIGSRRCGKDGIDVPNGRYVSKCLPRDGYSVLFTFQDARIAYGDTVAREQNVGLQYFSDGMCKNAYSGDIFTGRMLYGRDEKCLESTIKFRVQTMRRIPLSHEAAARFNSSPPRAPGVPPVCGEGFSATPPIGGSFLLQYGGREIYDLDGCEPPLGTMDVPYGKRKWHSLFRLTKGRFRMGMWREWGDAGSLTWEEPIDLFEDATLNRGALAPR